MHIASGSTGKIANFSHLDIASSNFEWLDAYDGIHMLGWPDPTLECHWTAFFIEI